MLASRFQGSAGKRPRVVLSYRVLPTPGLKAKAAPQTFPGPTSPLTEVQQLLHGQRGRAVAREMLDLAGDQGAGAAHHEACRLHLAAHRPGPELGLVCGEKADLGQQKGRDASGHESRWASGLVRPGLG